MPESGVKESGRLFCGQCKSIYRSGFDHCPNDQSLLEVLVNDPMIGETLGTHYVIDECVGEGAMGRVYLAHHSRLTKRKFAIKVLLGELAADPTMRMRFGQEAEAASRLQHTNVVPVLDYGKTDSGLLYLVMEFVEGDSLAERIAKGAVSEKDTITICKELCLGLTHAHDQGLVHRDFKPENVILVETDKKITPKILDFGLAIINSTEESSARLTSAGMVVGTPAYVSPEQARALPVDHRTDLFAFGVTMYEMIVGNLPFDGGVIEILYANATQDPPAFVERNPSTNVSVALEAVVLKMMAREQEERFQSAGEVYDALEAIEHAKSLRNTQEIVAEQIAQRDIVSARTETSDIRDASDSSLPVGLIANDEVSISESKSQKPLILWTGLALCLLLGGAFAYSKFGPKKATQELSQSVAVSENTESLPPVEDTNPVKTPELDDSQQPESPSTPDEEATAVMATENVGNNDPTEDEKVLDRATKSKASKSKNRNNRMSANNTNSRKREGTSINKRKEPSVPTEPKPDVETPEITPTPEVKPKIVVVAPPPIVKPVAKPIAKPVAPPKPKSFDATPSIAGLSVKGPMPSREIKRALSRKMSSLRTCYQAASKRSNKVPSISVGVSFVIDEASRASQIKVTGATLSGLGNCISSTIKKVQTRNSPDTGVARVSFSLKFSPK